MAATSKAALREITAKDYAKLVALLDGIDDSIALTKDEGGISPKDIVAHRAHWIALFLGWYRDGMAGKTVHFPAEGYKWNELNRYNAELRRRQAGLGWSEARALLEARYAELMAFIDGHSDAALYGGPMKGAKNRWTPGRWAEAAGPSHFRSAAKYIRARLRAAGQGRQAKR